MLVPAGRSGRVDLIAPGSNAVTAIGGFSGATTFGGDHDFGITSVDFGAGVLFATDRTTGLLAVLDPTSQKITGSVKLGGSPDYVRWVAPTREVWVTQPDSDRIGKPSESMTRAAITRAAVNVGLDKIEPVPQRATTRPRSRCAPRCASSLRASTP